MLKLTQLLQGLEYECRHGDLDCEVSVVANDSRKVVPGALFICISGAKSDGHDFAAEVVAKGARVLVVEREISLTELVNSPSSNATDSNTTDSSTLTIIKVPDSRYAMALIAANYYDHPARELQTIAVTGTKGKTTTTYLIKAILEEAGYKVGLIGTIEVIIGDRHIPAANTTPESLLLQQYLREMADAGLEMVVMEAASQGFKLQRTAGIVFDVGVFTNLSPDHIGPAEHADFAEYLACKQLLFRQCRQGFANLDNEYVNEVTEGHSCDLATFGILGEVSGACQPDLYATDLALYREKGQLGVRFTVGGLASFAASVATPGRFSVYNALAAIMVAHHYAVPSDIICKALKNVRVKGRIEMMAVSDEFSLMIDYAHNALSLESLLKSLRDYQPERLVCLFGCGGNRDRERRFAMGEASGRLADLSIITSDNPRHEEPQAIIDDIKTGMARTEGKYVEIIDRREAIAYVIEHGQPGDIIVLAGKGHEDYQEIKGEKFPMDERDIIEDVCKRNH